MNTIHRLALVLAATAALLVGCGGVPAQTPPAAGPTAQCHDISEAAVEELFDRWNDSLQTGDPAAVVANYAERSILLPTLSDTPRLTAPEKEDYFRHFLEDRPAGHVTLRMISIGCNSAVDAGLYTFSFAATGAEVEARYTFTYAWDGEQWLITSHHSSLMPGQE